MKVYWENVWYGRKKHYKMLCLETKNNTWGLLKVRAKVNETNSSLAVQCYAGEKCDFRHTSLCGSCEHNQGPEEIKSLYRPAKNTPTSIGGGSMSQGKMRRH